MLRKTRTQAGPDRMFKGSMSPMQDILLGEGSFDQKAKRSPQTRELGTVPNPHSAYRIPRVPGKRHPHPGI